MLERQKRRLQDVYRKLLPLLRKIKNEAILIFIDYWFLSFPPLLTLTIRIGCCCFRAKNICRNCHSVPRSYQSKIMFQSPGKRALLCIFLQFVGTNHTELSGLIRFPAKCGVLSAQPVTERRLGLHCLKGLTCTYVESFTARIRNGWTELWREEDPRWQDVWNWTFIPCSPFLLHLLLRENFQKCKEKESHIQESRILKNKVSFKYIFQPL